MSLSGIIWIAGISLLALRLASVGMNLYLLHSVAAEPENSASWAQIEVFLSLPSVAFGVLVLLLAGVAARISRANQRAGFFAAAVALLGAVGWLVYDALHLSQHPGWLVARVLVIGAALVAVYKRTRGVGSVGFGGSDA